VPGESSFGLAGKQVAAKTKREFQKSMVLRFAALEQEVVDMVAVQDIGAVGGGVSGTEKVWSRKSRMEGAHRKFCAAEESRHLMEFAAGKGAEVMARWREQSLPEPKLAQ
jgi:hypothetical protein